MFAANLKIPNKSEEDREIRVDQIIQDLGL